MYDYSQNKLHNNKQCKFLEHKYFTQYTTIILIGCNRRTVAPSTFCCHLRYCYTLSYFELFYFAYIYTLYIYLRTAMY